MVSLQLLLDVAELRLVPVHVPDPDAAVRWVATSELADPSPFLEGGEVLLTTGLETPAWRREWDPFVRRLATAGVVAIGLAVQLTHETSPAQLLAACRRHGVGLFEVPRATTFVAVSQAAARLLQAEDESAAQQALELQRRLTQAALREEEQQALVEVVAGIGTLACTVTADGAVDLGPFGSRPDLLDRTAVADAVARMRPQGLRAATSVGSAGGTLLIHPLGVRGRPSRYLVTGFPGRVTDVQRGTVTTAVALLSLAEERARAGRETDRRLRARALELLVQGDESTALLVLRLGPQPRPRLPKQAVVLRAHGPADRLDDGVELLEAGSLLGGVVADELVAVTGVRRAAELTDRLAALGLRVGVGEPAGLASLRRSHETAGHALELTTGHSPVASWETHVHRGVLALVDTDRAAAFGDSFVAALGGDGVLVETLRSFLLHHGSQLKVAEDLGVHRNTVRHRLGQIEAALGRSLADPQVRVDAWVALHARQAGSASTAQPNA